ncbi:MAG: hypothetical protein A3J63_01550 [Candidatus Moranbacteria bacterium RIFCSPHIGHO2_02_FULL_40_12b]|nr:MAG: hypothetical protein A3J63_01550 [Candidatus Moranbacteria bacterium RIFCSPHIGHO2_02_FULL_40_12b]OGI23502.1 MAG: hypothetical protein A3E91_01830 [Candidatus Moranbacteria bacterium RIFCSPHIGHO2_12_FULL_40_10]
MRILEINKFNFAKGGADRHFLDLVRMLRKNGNDAAVFSMDHSKNEESIWKKYFVSTVGYTGEFSIWQKIKGIFRMFYSFEAKRKINELLDDFQPDIAHIHNIYHQISPSILPQIKKRNIPIVMTAHDYKLICPDYLLRGENYGFWKFVTEKCFKDSFIKSFLVALESKFHKFLDIYDKNIDLYIVPSEFARNKLISNGIKENKIFILPHFIANQTNTALLNSNVVNAKNRYALYSGRISEEKGVDALINIFENIEGIKLYLAGESEDNFKIKKSANIKYLGYLNSNKLADRIKNAEIIVSGSRLPETFGLVALEAASFGKPFVGFNSGAYGEIIENGKNGFLVETKKDFIRVIKDIKNGRLKFNESEIRDLAIKKYDPSKYYGRIIGLFEKAKSVDSLRNIPRNLAEVK